jgi:hypothetical protein
MPRGSQGGVKPMKKKRKTMNSNDKYEYLPRIYFGKLF